MNGMRMLARWAVPAGRAPLRGACRVLPWLALASLVAGCNGAIIHRKDGQSTARPYTLANVAKTDVDQISELAQQEVLRGLMRMTEKLYRRNPQEYRKVGLRSVDQAVARIFDTLPEWAESPLARVDWMETLRLTFAESYEGDRVYAYMLGLTAMVMASYEHKTEFYLTDDLDAQKLYNSARNLEIAAWKLGQARRADGKPFLLSNALDEGARNLSFEREFGKLVGQQDLLALIIEDKTNRAVTKAIHNVASFALLPI